MTATLITDNPALRAIVEQTIDAKVFYQDEFKEACRGGWDATLPVTECRLPDLMQDGETTFQARQEEVRLAHEELKAGPRGTWMVVRRLHPNCTVGYLALIHDGAGTVHGRSDGWAAEPTFAAVVDRMIGSEVYDMRRVVEANRQRAACAAALEGMQIEVGTRLKQVTLGGQTYSTAVVTGIDPAIGYVSLRLTKRGSAKRYACSVPATRLAGHAEPRRTAPLVLVNGEALAA